MISDIFRGVWIFTIFENASIFALLSAAQYKNSFEKKKENEFSVLKVQGLHFKVRPSELLYDFFFFFLFTKL